MEKGVCVRREGLEGLRNVPAGSVDLMLAVEIRCDGICVFLNDYLSIRWDVDTHWTVRFLLSRLRDLNTVFRLALLVVFVGLEYV